jgi:hypothetical protein
LIDDLPPLFCRKSRRFGALTYPEPLGPPRPVTKYLYFIKFHFNPSTGSQLFLRANGQTNTTKQTIAFRSSAKALKYSYTVYIIDVIKTDNEIFTYGWFRAQIECNKLNFCLRVKTVLKKNVAKNIAHISSPTQFLLSFIVSNLTKQT